MHLIFSQPAILRLGPLLLSLAILLHPSTGFCEVYDPLLINQQTIETLDLKFSDAQRDKDIEVFVYLPASKMSEIILFSHGLGGSRMGNVYLGKHWAARGYAAVFLQHQGSDDAQWKDKPQSERRSALEEAANIRTFMSRLSDVKAVLDQLEIWNTEQGHALEGRLDMQHVGMSGHSFGAITTQAISGQQARVARLTPTDSRIDAAIAMSPSTPQRGTAEAAFGKVQIPWLLMTGTKDSFPFDDRDVESRLAVFPALPNGDKYELVLFDAQHSAFSDNAFRQVSRNPKHHEVIKAISTAFWDAYLKNDSDARQWLQGQGARLILEFQDGWQFK